MTSPKRTVLITGCSDGGLGAALAVAFHKAGQKVYATARNPAKMQELEALGIETITLDILSEASIAACVASLSALDILVNNAGQQFVKPLVHVDIAEAKKLYDINVWSHLAVTQAFLPLLLKSANAVVVNQTSVTAVTPIPFQGVYSSSKAALAMLTGVLRLELQPFGIKVVDLRTGHVKTNLIRNVQETGNTQLPEGSIYDPAKEVVNEVMRQEGFIDGGMAAEQWAEQVVQDLLKNPAQVIWRGESAWLTRIAAMLPYGVFDGMLKKVGGLDRVEKIMQEAAKK